MRLEARRGHGGVTQGRWASGREGLKETEEEAGRGGSGWEVGAGAKPQRPGRQQPQALGCFSFSKKKHKRIRNHDLACDEDSEIK